MAYTTVEGEVSRLNQSGNGYGVKEVLEFNGNTRTRYWSVFPPRDASRDVSVGLWVKVGGFLGTRVSEKDPRFVDHTLNNAKVLETAAPAVPDDGWSAPASYDDSTPF